MKRLLIIISLICFFSVQNFGQAIPKQFDYQGILKTSAGGIVPDGNYPMTFKIYNDPTGGAPIWTETQTIAVANGIFSAHLGNTTPITGVPFDRVHFLGITLGTEPELLPRTMLTPAPYSFMSLNIMDEAVTTSKIHDGAITDAKIGSNQIVKSLNGLKDDVTLVAGTNITLTPSGNSITINAGGGGGGTVTQVNTGSGLTGGPITTTGTISIPNDGITSAMLQSNSVTSAKIADGTIVAGDLGNNIITSNQIIDGTILGSDISNNTIGPEKLNFIPGTGTIGGSGTINYLPVFTNSNTLGNSKMFQNSDGDLQVGVDGIKTQLTLSANDNSVEGGQINLNGAGTNDDWYLDAYQHNMRIRSNSSNNNFVEIFNSSSGVSNLYVEGNVGIGLLSTSVTYPLHIIHPTSGHVIHSEYTGTTSADGVAVYGKSVPTDYYGIGGYFQGGYHGVYGEVIPSGSSYYYGVRGSVSGGTSPAGNRYGVYGIATGTGTGIRYGIYGTASGGATNWAGYFSGNVNVTGTLSKGGGSFKIDHPLDPANKYLYHSFVESPDMMNIYNGNVVTDGSGYATITLPDWFEALNKDFRYQLTVIGDFAQAIIAQKVQNNQFAIRTNKPNIEVSWQITGIRKDAWAEKNRIPVEESKTGKEVGKYIYPEAFGLPETMSIDYEQNNVDRVNNIK